ncbi:MAG: PAS domain-containing sensor histidine kinase [wastewater metagenome]|nr:PAS domain-containing sensor histidine kinase [Candidatus Loosdrechtia aerotolerans]
MSKEIKEKLQESSRILDILMEYIPEGISIALAIAFGDIQDIVIYKVSRYGAQLIGYSRKILENIHFKDIIKKLNICHADGITPATLEEMPLYRTIKKGEVVQDEEWVIHKSTGEKITLLIDTNPIRDLSDTIIGGISVWRDITKQKQIQKEIKDIAKFPDENPHPLLRIAQDGTLLYASPSCTPLLQDWDSKIGQPAPDFLYQIVVDAFQAKSIKENIEVNYRDKVFSFTIVPVIGTTYVNLYGVDVTRQKDAEKELERYREHLEELVETRTAELKILNKQLQQEIIERRRVEDVLRTSENRYRFLLDSIIIRIFYKDKNSVYIACNENYARDLHIKPEEIIGKTDYDFYPKELAEKYRTDDREVIETGQRKDTEERYIIDGQELIVHTVKVPIKNEKGESIGILGSFLDITEKVNLEKEAEMSRHLALIGELAAGVAHEINNPITGIINCAQILFNKSSEGSREKDLARRIIKEGDRIASIVSKLLSFARPGEERKRMTSITGIVSDTLMLMEKQLKKDSITIKLDISKDVPEIFVNSHEIQQVFMNIINNAWYALNQKYPGKHENKILEILGEKISIDKQSYVKITFYDHGTGVPTHIKDKIMNPFFTTKPHGEGTGLGLSISHDIIHEHSGKLTIDSVEGEFTKVIVILPAGEKIVFTV